MRNPVEVNILHNRNPIFILLSDGSIRNGYTVKILNKKLQPQEFIISVEGIDGLEMQVAGAQKKAQKEVVVMVPANGLESIRLFVRAAASNLKDEQTPFTFIVHNKNNTEKTTHAAVFYQPKK